LPHSLRNVFHSATHATADTIKRVNTTDAVHRIKDSIKAQLSDADIEALLPQGVTIKEFWHEMEGKIKDNVRSMSTGELPPPTPAKRLLQQSKMTKKHPVVLLPGFTTSGLESWCSGECGSDHFRHRLWGTMTMLRSLMSNHRGWLQHLMLDPETGLDPPNIRMRAAQGLEAADYFIGGYWVLAKLIENLATIGYDNSSMHLASYDWRLAFEDLETRDGFFTRLKAQVEVMYKLNGNTKVALIAHSMGALVCLYFLQWVHQKDGCGEEDWAKRYVHAVVEIGGPLLGVPKSVAAILSGEMRDTVQQPLGADAMERFFGRAERAEMFRTWGGLAAMLPKGGAPVWGDVQTGAPDGCGTGAFLYMDKGEGLNVEESLELLKQVTGAAWTQRFHGMYSFGLDRDGRTDKREWVNPLEAPLNDLGQDTTIYCLYGVGMSTERGYVYGEPPKEENEAMHKICATFIDKDKKIEKGVLLGDGDATVPTVSLGFMGAVAWRQKTWNPYGVPVVVREYKDETNPKEERGGIKSGDHVNILGNYELIARTIEMH
jgi:phospholipid:diacylglycerol acyltransferase